MSHPILKLAAAGVLGVAVWKVLSIFLLPLFGTLLGFLILALKIALLVGLVLLAVWWLRKSDDKKTDGETRPE
jgi:hypothetical protein